tara:strand:- start:51 stop:254 length:204 start_codon:yes stop_codon:yes gene_type:complete
MLNARELDYWDACCKTCKHKREHTSGITFDVCDVMSNDGVGLMSQIVKVDDEFVCGYWEEKEVESIR